MRSNMLGQGVPASCDHCGAIFRSPAWLISNSTITFTNCQVTCIRCGNPAKVLDGTFSFIGDLVEVISAPEWSVDALARMRAVIERHRTGGATLDDVINEIKSIAPAASDGLIDWIKANGIGLLGLLVTLLGLWISQADSEADREARSLELHQKDRLIGMLERQLEQRLSPEAPQENHNRPVAQNPLKKPQSANDAKHPNRKARRIAKSNTRPKPKPDWLR